MTEERQAIVTRALERAAEQIGDITAPVMAAFYARFPEARDSFVHHWPDRPAQLEQEMVGNALYFVMIWYERPSEVKYALWSSVPHHDVALHVPPTWYAGLMDATISVLAATAPNTDPAEAQMWRDMQVDLDQLIKTSL
ncbi:MAG: hypothetical protein RJB22_1246 [Pseudomonadota bacterium]|jgi:hypothetical protein